MSINIPNNNIEFTLYTKTVDDMFSYFKLNRNNFIDFIFNQNNPFSSIPFLYNDPFCLFNMGSNILSNIDDIINFNCSTYSNNFYICSSCKNIIRLFDFDNNNNNNNNISFFIEYGKYVG